MKKLLDKIHLDSWMVAILALVVILRIPSLFEPFSYGDEMIYLTLGNAVRKGIPLYLGVHDNKPPLLYLTAAVAGNVFWFRTILLFWSLFTVALFSKLSHALFPKNLKLVKIATLIFAILTTIPLLEGNIANSEVFMVGFTIWAFLILLTRKLSPNWLFISGILLSISALFKMPAAFDVPVIIIFWLIVAKKLGLSEVKKIATHTFWLTSGFLLPIAITLFWYFLQGAFHEYIVAAYLQNVGYLSSFRPGDVQEPFLNKNGPLLMRGAIVGLGLLITYFARKKLSKPFIFIIIWTLFSLFAVTLSERPYPHYLIQVVPQLSLLLAMLLTSKNREQVLSIIPITLIFLAPVYYRFWHYPTAPYYIRFVNFATGNISRNEYLQSFGNNVVRNYEITEFINNFVSKESNMFVWGDNAALYALSRKLPPTKYVVDYHINDFSTQEETIQILSNSPPKIIVVHPDAQNFPLLDELIYEKYVFLTEIAGSEIYSHFNSN